MHFIFRTSMFIESYIITKADIIFSVISTTLNGDDSHTHVYMLPVFIKSISVSLASLQPARAQYNECDCNIGQPDCQRIGECTGSVKNFTQTINANSGTLATVPVYEAGQMYYFTSKCIVTMINWHKYDHAPNLKF